ncbi:calcium-binding protein [Gemmobacter lanyuensis]
MAGGSGNDQLSGAAGDDTLTADGGTDTLVGGQGDSFLVTLAGAVGGVSDLGTGDVIQITAGTLAAVDIATFVATAASSNAGNAYLATRAAGGLIDMTLAQGPTGYRLTGAGVDTLIGSAGNDSLTGAAGADSLRGNGGDDTLWGGQGDALLQGDSGSDTLRLEADFTDASDAQIQGIETVVLGAAGLTVALTRQSEGMTLQSHAGGGAITGGGGGDLMLGGAGADQLSGGAGADTLQGGGGIDSLTGGEGADTFVFLAATDAPPAPHWTRSSISRRATGSTCPASMPTAPCRTVSPSSFWLARPFRGRRANLPPDCCGGTACFRCLRAM